MDKNTLRKVYLAKRKALSEAEYEKRNQLLHQQLVNLYEQHQFKSIHVYIPIKKNKEPDTFPFIKYLWNNRPETEVITAVSDVKSPRMHHVKITQATTFVENKWGIPEPKDGTPYPTDKMDCVLVPMIVGSKNGHRIGYGKGYYDRFLQKCENKTLLVGISLAPLLEVTTFIDPYDVPMDRMITPFEHIKMS